MNEVIEIEFEFEKDTKNTLRYKEIVEGDSVAKIGTLYLQKNAVPNPTPQRVRVSVSFDV